MATATGLPNELCPVAGSSKTEVRGFDRPRVEAAVVPDQSEQIRQIPLYPVVQVFCADPQGRRAVDTDLGKL